MPRTKQPAKRPVGRPRKNRQENVLNWQENVPKVQKFLDGIDTYVDKILDDRHETYGHFIHLAGVSQQLKKVLFHELAARNKDLAPDQIEAIEMILHKIARIVNGDEDHIDSWHDISGYATLVADRLKGNVR